MSTIINNFLIAIGVKRRAPARVNLPSSYIYAVMDRATVEWLPNDKLYYSAIPGFQGVYGMGDTKAAALADLESSLAEWAAVRLSRGMGIPGVEGQTNAVHA